jgi:hypothetical protein
MVASVTPASGMALVFRQPPAKELVHDGERVQRGVKYLIRTLRAACAVFFSGGFALCASNFMQNTQHPNKRLSRLPPPHFTTHHRYRRDVSAGDDRRSVSGRTYGCIECARPAHSEGNREMHSLDDWAMNGRCNTTHRARFATCARYVM